MTNQNHVKASEERLERIKLIQDAIRSCEAVIEECEQELRHYKYQLAQWQKLLREIEASK